MLDLVAKRTNSGKIFVPMIIMIAVQVRYLHVPAKHHAAELTCVVIAGQYCGAQRMILDVAFREVVMPEAAMGVRGRQV